MEESNKRIIKNTVYLYIRMLIMTALGFFTTRIVLEKLGVSDYGIYSLVGGFVSMFTVLNSILNTGTSRFIALALGKEDIELQKKTFSTSFTLHLGIALIVFLALESLGLWYLNTGLNIEPDRIVAANWVFQFSAISVSLTITQTPFTASVTAHEKFNMYAIMSVFDAISKLLILYLLVIISGDKLIIYSALLFAISLINLLIYRIYCIRKFPECGLSMKIDKILMKEMTGFAGWSTLGHVVTVVNSQGISILYNLFYNTALNAARGLSGTVTFMISNFISGFMTAAQPQLIKFYGAGDIQRFNKLIYNISQYSIFLIAIVMGPVLLEIDYVVFLWLGGNVPQYTTDFVKISMFLTLVYRSNSMIETGIQASGYVKLLNTWSVPVYLGVIPLVWYALWMGWGPIIAIIFANFAPVITFVINLIIIKRTIDFPSWNYFHVVFVKNLFLVLIALAIPYIIQLQLEQGLFRFLLICSLSVLCTITMLWLFGLNHEAKVMVKNKILGKYIKKFKNQ